MRLQRVTVCAHKRRLRFQPQIAAESPTVSVGHFEADSLRKVHRRTIGSRCTASINLFDASECGARFAFPAALSATGAATSESCSAVGIIFGELGVHSALHSVFEVELSGLALSEARDAGIVGRQRSSTCQHYRFLCRGDRAGKCFR